MHSLNINFCSIRNSLSNTIAYLNDGYKIDFIYRKSCVYSSPPPDTCSPPHPCQPQYRRRGTLGTFDFCVQFIVWPNKAELCRKRKHQTVTVILPPLLSFSTWRSDRGKSLTDRCEMSFLGLLEVNWKRSAMWCIHNRRNAIQSWIPCRASQKLVYYSANFIFNSWHFDY